MLLRIISHLVVAVVMVGTMVAAKSVLADVTVIYETQGQNLFRFQVPDDWEIRPGFEVDPSVLEDDNDPVARIVSLLPQEETLVMWTALWAPTGVNQLSQAKEYIQDVAPRLLSDVQITFRDDRMINGRKGRIVSGTGIRNEREFDFALIALQINDNRVAFAAFVGEPEAYDRHEKALIGVLNSIEPEGGSQ